MAETRTVLSDRQAQTACDIEGDRTQRCLARRQPLPAIEHLYISHDMRWRDIFSEENLPQIAETGDALETLAEASRKRIWAIIIDSLFRQSPNGLCMPDGLGPCGDENPTTTQNTANDFARNGPPSPFRDPAIPGPCCRPLLN